MKIAKSPLIMLTAAIVLGIFTISYYRGAPRRLISDGLRYSHEGRRPEAINSFKGALSFDRKSSPLLTLLGEEYFCSGDVTRSRFYFEKARACKEVDGKAYYYLGALMAIQGDSQNMLRLLKEGSGRTGEGGKAPCDLLRLLAGAMFPSRDDCQVSREEEVKLVKALSEGGSLFVTVHLGLISIYKGHFDTAEKIFTGLAGQHPDDSYLLTFQGISLLGEKKRDEALQALKKAARMDERNPVACECLGSLYLEDDNCDEAQKCLKQACRLGPNLPGSYYFLGLLAMKKARFNEAAALFEKSIALQPNNGRAHKKLSEAYEKIGLHDKARDEASSTLDGPLYISAPPY